MSENQQTHTRCHNFAWGNTQQFRVQSSRFRSL